ncbi:NAD-dependent epimerase/dehydratase family protein [Tomitella fengzijianii]|uniref:NAD-dependent epimerase/dehydratase family protein n=1 Tax=Tomitella fengzijianii TaxID=2597660 RepID=A0A516X734_9ACTN|nr:NAD-dependent epimerase/dehydratase family protein [Tomitella fengzijianii]QDQ98823.1 NAD-dependent epimerase/dehydratase family protein [Tomitella fengzijianii]
MRILVTGATGWIGSALVPQLVAARHHVVAAAVRSTAAAHKVRSLGAVPIRGDLEDTDSLRRAAEESDGVVHLAYRHDIAFTTDPAGAAETEHRVVTTLGEALAGSHRPLVVAAGLAGLPEGSVATETDRAVASGPAGKRIDAAAHALSLAEHGVRSSVVRLPPTVHGAGDTGFVPRLIDLARRTGISAYMGDGANRWPAVHRLDAARVFHVAAEHAEPGSTLHAVAEEGVPFRRLAERIAAHLDIAPASLNADAAAEHFGEFAGLAGGDFPASSVMTRKRLDWSPSEPALVDDLEGGGYFP